MRDPTLHDSTAEGPTMPANVEDEKWSVGEEAESASCKDAVRRGEAMASVAAALDTPVCTGETNYTSEDFRRMCQAGAADILMPDLMRMGGITEWLKAARLCQAFRRPVTPHLFMFMEASAHLVAACPNAVWQEHMPWWEPILKEPVDFRDGMIHLRDRPGLGLEWDERAVAKFELR